MKSIVTLVAAIAMSATVFAQAQKPTPTPTPTPKPVDISGKWVVALELSIGTSAPALEIKQDGEKIAGTYTSARYGTFQIKGTLKERRLQFVVPLDVDGTAVEMSFTGEVAADAKSIAGAVSIPGMDDGSWSAQRPK
jgi:hypothetical protein